MAQDRLYLDHAATTPLAAEVREAMLPWLDAGNASSLHREGRQSKAAIDRAREQVSNALGSLFAEVIFTSSGTEAANLALIGAALGNPDPRRNRILMGSTEHHCVLTTRPVLERLGYEVVLIPVDRQGRIEIESFRELLDDRALLVSAMHANNELGTFHDHRTIADLTKASGALLHVDAVQTFRAQSWTVDELRADLVTISAHKIRGPKGAGALYVRAGTQIKPLIYGGGQEREVRGGTENVSAIVGFGAAAALDRRALEPAARDRFEKRLVAQGAVATVTDAHRLPGHCHVRFPGVDAETMLIRLDRAGISASSGAACSSGSVEPSHVMLACGYSEREAREGLRFSFGSEATVEWAEKAADRVLEVAEGVHDARR